MRDKTQRNLLRYYLAEDSVGTISTEANEYNIFIKVFAFVKGDIVLNTINTCMK